MIHSSLPEAIEACIDAAGHEFDISRQRTLLRAASYGRAFCRLYFMMSYNKMFCAYSTYLLSRLHFLFSLASYVIVIILVLIKFSN